MGVDTMMAELEKLVPLGLKSVLLFSVTDMQKVRHKFIQKLATLRRPLSHDQILQPIYLI